MRSVLTVRCGSSLPLSVRRYWNRAILALRRQPQKPCTYSFTAHYNTTTQPQISRSLLHFRLQSRPFFLSGNGFCFVVPGIHFQGSFRRPRFFLTVRFGSARFY